MKSIFIIALVFQSTILYSQDTFYPHYIANPLEARVGSFYQPNVDRLRLDIGQTIDFTQHDLGDGWKGGFGTDALMRTFGRHDTP